MSIKWKKVLFDVLKYALAAILGALGVSSTGCTCIPQFFF